MTSFFGIPIPWARVARVFADACLISAATSAGMYVFAKPAGSVSSLAAAALAVPLGLLIFHVHGFYDRTRFYRTRFKLVVVIQAVTTLFGVLVVIGSLVPALNLIPKSAVIPTWLLAVALVAGARLWMIVWRIVEPNGDTSSVTSGRIDSASSKRVLVVGGAGYIGSALLPKLIEFGYQVRLLDAMVYGEEPIKEFLNHPSVELQIGDFRHVEAVVRACEGVDAVVHLGGIVGDPACSINEPLTVDVNLSATRMLADVARARGVRRFVFASTCSVYGASDGILDERSALRPVSLYAQTKMASERLLKEYSGGKMAVTILRFSTIFGFSGRIRFDLVVNLLTAQAVMQGRVTVKGGDQWRPFIHVDDAALAILMVLGAPVETVAEEIFNVGGNANNMQIADVGRLVGAEVPSAEVLEFPADGDRRNYRVNFDKIERRLGFKPRFSVRDGIREVIASFSDGRVPDWRDARYSNFESMIQGRVSLPVLDGWEDELLREMETESS